jgi:hypothetical protein
MSCNIFVLLLCTIDKLLHNFWVRTQSSRRLSILAGVPMGTTHWARGNERQRRIVKITEKYI